ncbi:argonaute-like protein [Punctularia strigosozonata HHB-11173 SS5]|uniref:Argonaute-like protein n=1 Tax=Punctularia strigosozonata (strain HHB-11173) TaxID=741275 RepID=R7S5G8_PUNST|nr:argonaute-like protein [Punctularia strigosozonata HHB-11173 SS5]EIN04651.1 argonaute-like protein [Punctularia strigosozonata HHB-11173 SS5]
MPPRARGSTSRGNTQPARGAPARGGGPARGGRGGTAIALGGAAGQPGLPVTHVAAVGIKRTAFGRAGKPLRILTNHFPVTEPSGTVRHYDEISPSNKILPVPFNRKIIKAMQDGHPEMFKPQGSYDGRKNLYTMHDLPFGNDDQGNPVLSRIFEVYLPDDAPRGKEQKPKRPFRVKLTRVALINLEPLVRFLEGKKTYDPDMQTGINALDIAIHMAPSLLYPTNGRSFFTSQETRNIGGGMELWRGYFQSIRPAIGRMLVNVDISTGMMFKPGRLFDLCIDHLGLKPGDYAALSPARGMPDSKRLQLRHFLMGVRVQVEVDTSGRPIGDARPISGLSLAGASQEMFEMRSEQGGQMISVAEYYRRYKNRTLQFPQVLCVRLGRALIPMELCYVPPGQVMKRQMPQDKANDVVQFATMKPPERLASIRRGLTILNYGQSQYIASFGLQVSEAPVQMTARQLAPPRMRYAPGSREPMITPKGGAWNMVDKKFWNPATIKYWAVVIFERPNRFREDNAASTVRGLIEAATACGMVVHDKNPLVDYANGQGNIHQQLLQIGIKIKQAKNELPNLIVCVMPDQSADLYSAIKHFGDITTGVATQCLKSSKCFRANQQYFANVCLKINGKLGGVDRVPDPQSVPALTDPANPAIVMGADTMHPAPGATGRPSYASLVASVDSHACRYIAQSRVQVSRQEMIADLKDMCKHSLDMYMKSPYRSAEERARKKAPARLIFYRDGVSESQLQQVLDNELTQIQEACKELGIDPKITLFVVGKRHHTRLFPEDPRDADRSGNCPAGTVVDNVITHPVESDFYLLSHGGLLGTSRPAHYNPVYDSNNFTADDIQALTFALCHNYARATRSVSIPAPVYYADIVCARAKHHYAPDAHLNYTETMTQSSDQAAATLRSFTDLFKPLHTQTSRTMYFL